MCTIRAGLPSLFCGVLCRALLLCRGVPCRALLWCTVPCFTVVHRAVLYCGVPCLALLWCTVPCFVVVYRAVLRCTVLFAPNHDHDQIIKDAKDGVRDSAQLVIVSYDLATRMVDKSLLWKGQVR